MHRGYFAIWRKFQDHPFWKEKRVYSKAEAWIDLLWEAQHDLEPQEVVLGMTNLFVTYGESLKSLETWSKRWRWNKSRVRRFLKLLENMGQIVTVNETKTTRIIILNYSQYDPKRNKSETQVKRKRNASETRATPDNNDNNDNNYNKVEFDDFYKHYPCRFCLGQAEKAWNKLKVTKPLLEKMLLSLEQQKESQDWKKNNGKFIPYPSSWLNGRRWEDEDDPSNNQCESCYYKIHENLNCHKEGRKECKSHRPV